MRPRVEFLIWWWLLLVPALAWSTTRYASPGGGGDCSFGNPCSVGTGLSQTNAGDTLYLRGGTYNLVLDDNNFTIHTGTDWNNPVTIASAPNETATLHGSGDHTLGLGQAVWYIIFDRLVIDGSSCTFGVSFFGSQRVRFQNSEVRNAQASGILSNLSLVNNNEYLNLHLHHNGSSRFDHGIYLEGQNNTIAGSEMDHNQGYGIHIYNGGGATGSNIIYGNRVHDNFGDGGVTLSAGDNHLFYNNLVYNNNGYGITVGFNGANNTRIYNNTIYGNSYYAINLRNGVTNTDIRNNIFNANNPDSIDDFGSGGTILSPNFTSAVNFVDPGNADFHLVSGTGAIDSGAVNLSSVFTTDFAGTTRPLGSGFDFGAYEFGSVPPPTNVRFTTQPTTTPVNQTMAPVVVQVQDTNGNLSSSSSASITLAIGTNPSSGVLNGTMTRTAQSGQATFDDLSITQSGAGYTLVATSPGLTADTSTPFTIGGSARVAFNAEPQNTTAGQPLAAITVYILDTAGTLVNSSANVSVAIATNPSGGILSGTTTQAAVGGIATFTNLSINQPGIGYTLQAASSGLASDLSQPFTLQAPGPANVEWVAKEESPLLCVAYNGDTNLSSANPGTDYLHNLTCTLPANALRTNKTVRACALVAVHTGTSSVALTHGLMLGGTKVISNTGIPIAANITTSTQWVCYVLAGSAAPGPNAPVLSSFNTHYPEGIQFSTDRQELPVSHALATNGPLPLRLFSTWASAGVGDNTFQLLGLEVEVQQ